jgi:alkanesulfonate monooxygenase SsuD/methylene tetrahydromethanopterin reductase-like flavin-dependent oxidoreductase (luciferase family)
MAQGGGQQRSWQCAMRGLSSIKEGGTGDRIDKCAWASSSAMARREKLTLRELYYRVAAARGHLLLIGTGTEIADVLERWFRAGVADGFNVMPPFFPGQFDAFAALRQHLELRRPATHR